MQAEQVMAAAKQPDVEKLCKKRIEVSAPDGVHENCRCRLNAWKRESSRQGRVLADAGSLKDAAHGAEWSLFCNPARLRQSQLFILEGRRSLLR